MRQSRAISARMIPCAVRSAEGRGCVGEQAFEARARNLIHGIDLRVRGVDPLNELPHVADLTLGPRWRDLQSTARVRGGRRAVR